MVSGHLRIQNGIYQCIISYNDYNGKRKTKSISTGLVAKGNKKRAEEMLSELRRTFVPPKPERGENEFREDMLFSDFIPLWLSAIEKTVKPTTYSSYRNMAMKKILPYFEAKKLKLNEVKASHIQNFCIHELKSIGANSVKHEYVLLHKMFKYAYRMDLVVNNPVEKVDPPKIMPFEGKPFTADELQKLLTAQCPRAQKQLQQQEHLLIGQKIVGTQPIGFGALVIFRLCVSRNAAALAEKRFAFEKIP